MHGADSAEGADSAASGWLGANYFDKSPEDVLAEDCCDKYALMCGDAVFPK